MKIFDDYAQPFLSAKTSLHAYERCAMLGDHRSAYEHAIEAMYFAQQLANLSEAKMAEEESSHRDQE